MQRSWDRRHEQEGCARMRVDRKPKVSGGNTLCRDSVDRFIQWDRRAETTALDTKSKDRDGGSPSDMKRP